MKQTGQALIYVLLVVFVAAAGGGIVYTYNSAITRAERAEAENVNLRDVNAQQLAENDRLAKDNAKKDKLLAVRAAQRNAADEVERRLNAKLDELRNSTPAVREWAGQPVPADVLVGLRNDAGTGQPKDGKGAPAGKPAGGSAGSGVAADDYKLGPARSGPRLSAPAAGVQR